MLVFSLFLVIGCTSSFGADEPITPMSTVTEVGPTPTLPPGIFFPQTALIDGEWVRMTGEIYGMVVEENGCIRLISSNGGTSYLVIWPHHYWPDVENGRIQILDETGQVAAVVGQETEVHMGGGEGESLEGTFYVPEQVVQAIPAECPGPYFISGGFIQESEKAGF
jgi:hypothetical protein